MVKRFSTDESGVITLISTLIVGAIGLVLSLTILTLSVDASRTSTILEQSQQADAYGHACAEYALNQLRLNVSYAGNEILSFTQGSCQVRPLLGSGNTNRTIQTIGISGTITKRGVVVVNTRIPTISLASWRDIGSF